MLAQLYEAIETEARRRNGDVLSVVIDRLNNKDGFRIWTEAGRGRPLAVHHTIQMIDNPLFLANNPLKLLYFTG